MFAPFAFVLGYFLLLVGEAGQVATKAYNEKVYKEKLSEGYNYEIQQQYTMDRATLWNMYYISGMMDLLREMFPDITPYNQARIAEAAAVKHWMSLDGYKYEEPDYCKGYDLDFYVIKNKYWDWDLEEELRGISE